MSQMTALNRAVLLVKKKFCRLSVF